MDGMRRRRDSPKRQPASVEEERAVADALDKMEGRECEKEVVPASSPSESGAPHSERPQESRGEDSEVHTCLLESKGQG